MSVESHIINQPILPFLLSLPAFPSKLHLTPPLFIRLYISPPVSFAPQPPQNPEYGTDQSGVWKPEACRSEWGD